MKKFSVIFLFCPGHQYWQLEEMVKREGFTEVEEMEPKAGCRRFRLSKEVE